MHRRFNRKNKCLGCRRKSGGKCGGKSGTAERKAHERELWR